MKTFLITGGAGFIGTNFIYYMMKNYRNIKILNVDCLTYAGNINNLKHLENNENYKFELANICDKNAISEIFEKNNVDYVVNFAAETHVDKSIENPEIFLKTNVLGTLNLLDTAKKYWTISEGVYREGCKYIQISTDEVYGSLGKNGYFSESSHLNPHSPYSVSKASADMLVQSYFHTFKFPACITRCSNNYGPYQFPEKLVPLIIKNALEHKKIPIYGDGLHIRDWLYVEDHCRAIDLVIKKGTTGETYNIGGHNEKDNISIVKFILSYLKNNVDKNISENLIEYVADRKGHDRRYGIDYEKIKNDLGWDPETTFEIGIKKTIDWYVNNIN